MGKMTTFLASTVFAFTALTAIASAEAITVKPGGAANIVLLPKFLGILPFDQANRGAEEAHKELANTGTLQYIGVGNSSNRRITLGLAGGGLDASGTGAIIMSNAGMTLTPGGARTLTLSGSSTSTNLLKTVVANDGANPTSFRKTGTGTWLA